MEDKIMSPIEIDPTETVEVEPRTMDFYDALKEIAAGRSVKRISWGNDDYCLMKDFWLTIFTKGEFHTWSINDGDMAGQDWVVVESK